MSDDTKTYFEREKKLFIPLLSICAGLFLWANSYLYFGTLDFWDIFPSHESIGLILIIFGFGYISLNWFNYLLPGWLKTKNSQKLDKIKNIFKLK